MKIKTVFLSVLLFVTFSCTVKQQQKSKFPNVVIIYADDLGYGDVQSYNPVNGKIPTPNMDRLASEGMRFTDAHSSSAVCSPSRYTILTGRYHWRTRLQEGIVGDLRAGAHGAPVIPPDRLTIGGLAKQQGYNTACIGKWHLGWDWPIPEGKRDLFRSKKKNVVATDQHRKIWREVFSQKIPGGPTAVGFDEYFGVDVPNWPPYCFIEDDKTIGIPSEFGSASLFGRNQADNQGPSIKNWKLEEILPALGDRSVDFIERMSKSSEPFLLYMPLTSPHTPLSVNKEWIGKSGISLYADLVMETDAIVGRLLDALEKSGEADNTIVIFTSDNGCAPYVGDVTLAEASDTTFRDWSYWIRKKREDMSVAAMEEKGHYPSGPLRGYKSDVWEGGHRVPFIVRWPGTVNPGSISSQLVHQADILATIAEIMDASLPPDVGEDSFSLLPLLKGEDNPVRENAVSTSDDGLPSLRSGSWKLILGPGSGGLLLGNDGETVQLYNLENDIGETKNFAGELPGRVREMKILMEKLITDGRSTAGPLQKNDVKVKRYDK